MVYLYVAIMEQYAITICSLTYYWDYVKGLPFDRYFVTSYNKKKVNFINKKS